MSRTTVLLIGRGASAARLRTHFKRRGYRVRAATDCGAAMESLRGDAPTAVVLDVEGAGFAADSFREMLLADHPRLPVLDVPHGAGERSDDLGLFVATVEQAVEKRLREEDREADGAGSEAPERDGEPQTDTAISGYKFEDLTSSNGRMLELFDLIPRVARTDSPVLIHGETGTGKELVAAALHRQSKRRDGPFFTVNCGALTDGLLESELFGHEKGAFTGAYRRKEGTSSSRAAARSSSTSSGPSLPPCR